MNRVVDRELGITTVYGSPFSVNSVIVVLL